MSSAEGERGISGWAAAVCLRLLQRLLQRVRERDPPDQLLDVRFQQIATGHLGIMRASVSTQGALWLSGAAAHMIVQGSSQRLECTIARVLGMVVEEHGAAAPHELACHSGVIDGPRPPLTVTMTPALTLTFAPRPARTNPALSSPSPSPSAQSSPDPPPPHPKGSAAPCLQWRSPCDRSRLPTPRTRSSRARVPSRVRFLLPAPPPLRESRSAATGEGVLERTGHATSTGGTTRTTARERKKPQGQSGMAGGDAIWRGHCAWRSPELRQMRPSDRPMGHAPWH